MVPSSSALSLKDFDELGTEMVRRYRAARAEGDVQTAKDVLGRFEELVHSTESASERLTRKLNDWVSFLVLPLFALSNAGVTFSAEAWSGLLTSHITWGVLLGLVLGKPLGILGILLAGSPCRDCAVVTASELAADDRSWDSRGDRFHSVDFH